MFRQKANAEKAKAESVIFENVAKIPLSACFFNDRFQSERNRKVEIF